MIDRTQIDRAVKALSVHSWEELAKLYHAGIAEGFGEEEIVRRMAPDCAGAAFFDDHLALEVAREAYRRIDDATRALNAANRSQP